MKPHQAIFGIYFLTFLTPSPSVFAELNLQELSEPDIQTVRTILEKWEPLIEERKSAKNLSTLRFEDLYLKLEEREVNFVKEFLAIDPVKAGIHTKWQGLAFGTEELSEKDWIGVLPAIIAEFSNTKANVSLLFRN